MRRLALLLVLLATPPALAAQVAPALEARVRRAVATAWDADSAQVVLAWGSGPLRQLEDTAGFRLLGRGEGGWFALVVDGPGGRPVALRLRAGIRGTRAVAARALVAGTRLVPDDIRLEPWTRWDPPGDTGDVVEAGWVVRRRLAPGDALEGYRVSPPPVVEQGSPVRVWWRDGNVQVALAGVALNDAGLGQPVKVRTEGRTGVIAGTVTAAGEARMNR